VQTSSIPPHLFVNDALLLFRFDVRKGDAVVAVVAAVFARQCRSRARGKQEKKKKNSSGWKAFETKKELLRDEKNTDNAVVCNPAAFIFTFGSLFFR
jgi:hypothetical protein